jgi:uncharacterized membrane protein (Fun14 family)
MKRRKLFRIGGIFCAVIGLISLLAAEIAIGIVLLVVGCFFIVMSILPDKALMNVDELRKHLTADDTYFIEYTDFDGNFSSRTIGIIKVYRRGRKVYIDAYCHLAEDSRTFLVQRIKSMKKDDIIIEDIEAYLTDKYIKKL